MDLALLMHSPWSCSFCSLAWLLFLALATCEISEMLVLSEFDRHLLHPSLLLDPNVHTLGIWKDHVDVHLDDDKWCPDNVARQGRKCHI